MLTTVHRDSADYIPWQEYWGIQERMSYFGRCYRNGGKSKFLLFLQGSRTTAIISVTEADAPSSV
ncbi:MAG: hypothetical protein K8S15_03965, partial [Candidatus Aegiribacteria sp.]|nr:hypothetical protein [Candidatus Aegiribacteria sp.]